MTFWDGLLIGVVLSIVVDAAVLVFARRRLLRGLRQLHVWLEGSR